MAWHEIEGPFDAAGNWYRGCLHSHSTESDGWTSPERLIQHYQRGGYDFLAITDHGKVTDRTGLGTPGFLVLPGTEAAVGESELGQRFHIVGIGVREPIQPEGSASISAADAIAEIRRQGAEAIVAHPYWSGLTAGDLLDLPGYAALEVYNTTCQGIGRSTSQYVWDELLARGRLVRVVASDDCHRPGGDSRRAWTVVRAPELSAGAVLEALRRGHFYASTGPEMYSVSVGDGTVEVECSPAQAVELVCDPTRGCRLAAGPGSDAYRAIRNRSRQLAEGIVEGNLLTGATFVVPAGARYARVQVVDRAGRMAWTNPVFVAE